MTVSRPIHRTISLYSLLLWRLLVCRLITIRKIGKRITPKRRSVLANVFLRPGLKKRALVSYSTSSFLTPNWADLRSSDIDLRLLIAELNDRGYVVDLVDGRSDFCSSATYDLVFGMGAPWRTAMVNPTSGYRIMFLTEAPPAISRKNETRRRKIYATRNGVMPPEIRSGVFFWQSDFLLADAVIYLGDDEKNRKSLIQKACSNNLVPVLSLLPSTGRTEKELIEQKEVDRDASVFVQVGAGGCIHKGVDLLCEAFSQAPNLQLELLGHVGLERFLLHRPNNVQFRGYLPMSGHIAHEILTKARFSILHSASEAVPTGVLLSMLYGCIPVLSRNCGVNLAFADFAFFIDSENPAEIATFLQKISMTTEEELLRRSALARSFAASRATNSFNDDLCKVLDRLAIGATYSSAI